MNDGKTNHRQMLRRNLEETQRGEKCGEEHDSEEETKSDQRPLSIRPSPPTALRGRRRGDPWKIEIEVEVEVGNKINVWHGACLRFMDLIGRDCVTRYAQVSVDIPNEGYLSN